MYNLLRELLLQSIPCGHLSCFVENYQHTPVTTDLTHLGYAFYQLANLKS